MILLDYSVNVEHTVHGEEGLIMVMDWAVHVNDHVVVPTEIEI